MDPKDRRRIIALLGMLGSSHEGEVLNAARLAQRFIGELQLTWEEVMNATGETDRYRDGYNDGYRVGLAHGTAKPRGVTPGTSFVSWVRTLRDMYNDDLTDWEQGFVGSFLERGWATPTPKQRAVFERIAGKLDLGDLP